MNDMKRAQQDKAPKSKCSSSGVLYHKIQLTS